jgi:hypothetical protein
LGYGWGWGWNPYLWGRSTYVSSSTEGTLFIDLIDAKKKKLVWQGRYWLPNENRVKRKKINEFVAKF